MLRSRLSFLGILFLFISLLIPSGIVQADVAPPEQPPGSNLHPGIEATQVRMVAERVLIEILDDAPQGSLGHAHVTAEFQMRNMSSQEEVLMVRFPISSNDGFYNFPEIQDLQVRVDGNLVSTTRGEYIGGVFDDIIPWAEFEVVFPVGQDVFIEVDYTLEGTGEYPYISFKYLLETGAGWNYTIGSVDLIVRLPYEVNHHNVFIESSPGWGQTSPGAVVEGQELRWHYDELEPEYQHNLSVVMVMPGAWDKVLTERENVALNPQDGEAWEDWEKYTKKSAFCAEVSVLIKGGIELFDLSAEAYQKSLELLPDDALWHAGYAELLHSRYYWEEMIAGGYSLRNYMQAIEEFALAYSLAPENPKIQEMLLDVYYGSDAIEIVDDEYIFRWLTVTPTLAPTSTPTPGG